MRPVWLNKKVRLKDCDLLKRKLSGCNVSTVCQEAACPNISECFSRGIASFLILGSVCTRGCKFCGVLQGVPCPLDIHEPERIAQAVSYLDPEFIVLTSVTRDDLPDYGASHFAQTVQVIRKNNPLIKIETLIPDFKGRADLISKLVFSKPDVISHNIEMPEFLYARVRPLSDYKISLSVLKKAKQSDSSLYTKSGIMLGLGESRKDVLRMLSDLREVNCDFLSLGQYLPPSRKHYPVVEYVHPDMFSFYREQALSLGFKAVKSGPYVRSSYMAEEYMQSIGKF